MRYLALVIAAVLALGFPVSVARADWLDDYRAGLASAHLAESAAAARGRLAARPGDQQAHFALGMAQFFGSVEHLAQGLYRYGLVSDYDYPGLGGLMPALRLPVPSNPHPEPMTYDVLRGLFETFVDETQASADTLGGVKDVAVVLPLNIGRIALDLDGDGKAGPGERLWEVLRAITAVGSLSDAEVDTLNVDFDLGDARWLEAYAHLLIAIADFPLSYDFRAAYDATFQNLFPSGAFTGPLAEARPVLLKQLEEFLAAGPVPQMPYEVFLREGSYQKWLASEEGQRYQQYERLRSALNYGGVVDAVAFIHLMQWEVVEPARLAAVREHLKAMVTLSQQSWDAIFAETDNAREWIPKPGQHTTLRMNIDQPRIDAWRHMLTELGLVLDGEKLLPHWRLAKGISLKRFFTEPARFDLVLVFQGTGAAPWLADGPMTDPSVWSGVSQVFGGDFLRYFLWLN